MILAGDVGGTKILLEAGDFRSGRWEPVLARRYLIADFETFPDVMSAFLGELGGEVRVAAGCIGVAGFVKGGCVKMTNRPWVIDGAAIAARHGIPKVRLLNDLAAAASGIDDLADDDFTTIQPGAAVPGAPRVVLGVGTGLGVAYLIPPTPRTDPEPGHDGPRPDLVVPSEGGHMGFSPGSVEQSELWRAMAATRGRVEAEDLCSGKGITNIYEYLSRGGLAAGGVPVGDPNRPEPAWVSQQAFEHNDPISRKTLDLFAECLGNVAGDHVLAVMARGGVILAGGIAAKVATQFNHERFRGAFCAKGHFTAELMQVPVRIAHNERAALIGAARVARSLVA